MSLGNLGSQINHQKTNKPFISIDNAYETHSKTYEACGGEACD